MTFKFESDIQEILEEHNIKFKAEELRDFPRRERIAILVRGFRAVNLVDAFLLFIVISFLIETRFEINIVSLLAALAMGYSAWRFQNYLQAASKLKRLYKDA